MKKIALFASVLILGTSAMTFAQNTLTIENPQPYIEVTGTATTRVKPNKIEVSVTLNEADNKGKTTLAQLERALANALQEAGVDANTQLVVTDQSSSGEKKKTIYQYKSYLVTLASGAEVSSLFESLKSNGISNANVVNTTRTDLEQLQQAGKIEAVKNAQANASALAGAVNQTIGKAIMIQDYSTPYMPLYRNTMMVKSEASADTVLADTEFQDIRIDHRVTVRFILD